MINEFWSYGSGYYKFFSTDKTIIKRLLSLSGAIKSGLYLDSHLGFLGRDIIIPSNRLMIAKKLSGAVHIN